MKYVSFCRFSHAGQNLVSSHPLERAENTVSIQNSSSINAFKECSVEFNRMRNKILTFLMIHNVMNDLNEVSGTVSSVLLLVNPNLSPTESEQIEHIP